MVLQLFGERYGVEQMPVADRAVRPDSHHDGPTVDTTSRSRKIVDRVDVDRFVSIGLEQVVGVADQLTVPRGGFRS